MVLLENWSRKGRGGFKASDWRLVMKDSLRRECLLGLSHSVRQTRAHRELDLVPRWQSKMHGRV